MDSTDASWAKRSHEEVDKILCSPGSLHELETRVIDGLVQRVYKNLWPSVRVFWMFVSQLHAEKTCVVLENQRFTFGQIMERALRGASVFRDVYGVRKGDRVAICSRNYPEYIVAFWACHLIGAVPVLVNAWLPMKTLRHCLLQTQCKLIMVDPQRADQLEGNTAEFRASGVVGWVVIESHEGKGLWAGMDNWHSVLESYRGDTRKILKEDLRIEPEDNAVIIFTSGTSGLPKGVLSTQRMFLSCLLNSIAGRIRAMLRRGEDLTFQPALEPQAGVLLPSPLFHVTGTSLLLIAALMGHKLVLMRKWNVETAARLLKEENIKAAGGVSTIVADLVDSSAAGHPLESVLYGGALVSRDAANRARKAFPGALLGQAYGMTESNATAVGFVGEEYHNRLNSCGRAMPINDVMVVNGDVRCPNGTVGEVWIRGPNVMKEYWGDPVATSRALTKDGWLKTGDMGYMDDEGFLYIKDRLKDMIIRGGENVDSVAVENAFYTDERVKEAAAVGVPDVRLGELVTAIVTVKPRFKGQVSAKSLMALAKKHLPKFAVPVMVLIREEEFDHTPSGKIIKAGLRKIAAEEWMKRSKESSPKAKM